MGEPMPLGPRPYVPPISTPPAPAPGGGVTTTPPIPIAVPLPRTGDTPSPAPAPSGSRQPVPGGTKTDTEKCKKCDDLVRNDGTKWYNTRNMTYGDYAYWNLAPYGGMDGTQRDAIAWIKSNLRIHHGGRGTAIDHRGDLDRGPTDWDSTKYGGGWHVTVEYSRSQWVQSARGFEACTDTAKGPLIERYLRISEVHN